VTALGWEVGRPLGAACVVLGWEAAFDIVSALVGAA
jgi:hypothetical protein